MSPEKGLLEQYIETRELEGNLNAVEKAKELRKQFGDIVAPLDSEGGVKPSLPEPEILYILEADLQKARSFIKTILESEGN